MKYKKVVAVLLAVGCIGLVGTLGYFLGQTNQKGPDVKQVVAPVAETENTKQESRKIAVVNLDEGTTSAEEKINYADKIVQFPSSSFEYSSLEEARTGLTNGKYGAYIIIPAGFSQNVVSLNTTPQAAQLEYALNKNFSGESQYHLLYDVMSFGNSLNDSLSYMYLNNILSEFHKAQDGATTVMNNDLKDKDAIESIQSHDLVQLVEIPELKREENTTEPLNVEEYVEKNTALATDLDSQYKKCVEEAQLQLQDMQTEGGSLSEQLTSLAEYTEQLDVFKDEDGNSVVDSANNKLDEVLNKKPGNTVDTMLEDLKRQPNIIAGELGKSIEIYNQGLPKQLTDRLNEFANKIEAANPGLVLEKTSEGGLELHYATSDSPRLSITLADAPNSEENQQANMTKQLWSAITSKLATAANEQETIEIMEEDPDLGIEIPKVYTTAKSVKTALAECEQDPNMIAMCNSLGYSSVNAFVSDAGNGSLSLDKTHEIVFDGDLNAFQQYINSVIENVPREVTALQEYKDYRYDEAGNMIIDPETNQPTAIQDRLKHYGTQVEALETELGNEHTTNGQEIKNVFKDFYVDPMQKNQENFNGILQQKYEAESVYINEFNEKLKAFAPSVQDEYIAENVNGIKENNGLLQKSLIENNMSYVDYANKVYTTTEENINTLQKGIQDAKDASNQAVEDGLNAAKNTKATTSKENQNILADFSSKLPYTRLGSMEYTQAYQFIAKPINLNDVSKEKEKVVEGKEVKETSAKAVSAKTTKESNITSYLIYIVFAVLLSALIIFLILRYFRNKKPEQ